MFVDIYKGKTIEDLEKIKHYCDLEIRKNERCQKREKIN